MDYYINACSICNKINQVDAFQQKEIMMFDNRDAIIEKNQNYIIAWLKNSPNKFVEIGSYPNNATRTKIDEVFYFRLKEIFANKENNFHFTD